MSAPTNRVSHHLLQAQTIHNEVRAQRDELVQRLKDVLGLLPPVCSHPIGAPNSHARAEQDHDIATRERARRAIARVDSFTTTEGETQL